MNLQEIKLKKWLFHTSNFLYMKNKFLISPEVQNYIKKKSPEIGILSPSLDTIPSKQGSAIYYLIEDIADCSAYPLLVFSKYRSDLPKSKIRDRIIYYTRPIKKTIIQNLMGHRLRKKIYGISATEDIWYAKDVYRFCRKNHIKCLVVEDANSLLAGLPGKPTVHIILHQHANALLFHTPHYFQKFTSKIACIIFVSERNRKDVIEKFGNLKMPNSAIYNGINLDNFKIFTKKEVALFRNYFDTEDKSIILLFTGRIHLSKGIRELFLSLRFLKEFKIKVLVAGDLKTSYDPNPDFEDELNKLQSDNIVFLGTVTQGKLSEYYAICDFVVVPSIGLEGLPKVVTEALVMGKPVIASDRGGIVELVKDGENGIIIKEPVSPENIAMAIRKAIENYDLLSQTAAEQMKMNRSKFSSSMMAKQFDDIFKNYL